MVEQIVALTLQNDYKKQFEGKDLLGIFGQNSGRNFSLFFDSFHEKLS